jgi:hypothetical protein
MSASNKSKQTRMEKGLMVNRIENYVISSIGIGASAGIGFYLGNVGVQTIASILKFPSSTRRGSILGVIGIGLSSAISVTCADIFKFREFRGNQIFGDNDWERLVSVTATIFVGASFFGILGGRVRSVLPSDYCRPGAFACERGSIPASVKYAEAREKGGIEMVGRLFGCHTCGNQDAIKYIGDHMPPNKLAKEQNEKWYRRWILGNIKQAFYPQCESCSLIQSVEVRTQKGNVKTHFKQLRSYHLTGILIGWWWFGSWIPLWD